MNLPIKTAAFVCTLFCSILTLFACDNNTTTLESSSDSTSYITTTTPATTTETIPETTTTSEIFDIDGTYVLSSKQIDDFDASGLSVFEVLVLTEQGTAAMRKLDMYGLTESTGTYSLSDSNLIVAIGLKNYDFILDKENNTLTYSGRIDRRQVDMTYVRDDNFMSANTSGGVSFYAELFGEDINADFYNYCPTIMMEGNNIMHIWYCANMSSSNITDYIAYRRGTLLGDGTWDFTERQLVLSPSDGTWDERHTCDPSVIKGTFLYSGVTYDYLMAYLGCVSNDSSRNEVGIAVAESPEGPWIKVTELNPIANYYESFEYTDSVWTWGYGQPSLVSVDKAGKVLLFYTKGVVSGTYSYVEYWDLSDIDNATKLAEAPVTNSGVVNASGITDVINNGDFGYDPYTSRLYVIKEDFPYPNNGGTTWITGANTLLFLNLDIEETHVGQTLFSGEQLRWQVIDSVGINETGQARNHNFGLITDEYGWIIDPFHIPLVYTKADLVDDFPDWESGVHWASLHTYRLYGYVLEP